MITIATRIEIEISQVLVNNGMSETELDELFNAVDSDDSGHIDYSGIKEPIHYR